MSLGRDWVGQDAKPRMTYEQFLNQTREVGKLEGEGGERRERGKQGLRVAAIQVLCFYFHICGLRV